MWQSGGRVWRIWYGMMFEIRNVTPMDLNAVTALEALCFPPAEAATREAFAYRIGAFPERFFVAEQDRQIIGLINGCASGLETIEDRLFEPRGHKPDGKNQMIFGLAVHPDHRCCGVAAALMERMIAFARKKGMERVILTCKEEKIPYYSKFGFQNQGISQSTHGGAVWYDMTLFL